MIFSQIIHKVKKRKNVSRELFHVPGSSWCMRSLISRNVPTTNYASYQTEKDSNLEIIAVGHSLIVAMFLNGGTRFSIAVGQKRKQSKPYLINVLDNQKFNRTWD